MNYLVRNIDSTHIVWFAKSNQWVQLDEPQWFIFLLYQQQTSISEAAQLYVKNFEIPFQQARDLVESFYSSIDKLSLEGFPLPGFSQKSKEASQFIIAKSKTRHYNWEGKPFTITYGSSFLFEYIHLPFSHLECHENKQGGLHLEIFLFKELFALRSHPDPDKCFTARESGQIKRLLFIELSNYFFEKKTDDWMSLLHASALQRGGELLVLSSSSGAGKSTLAAVLQKEGFSMFSDDFIPVDNTHHQAYPFPAALSVKKGGISVLSQAGITPNILSPSGAAYVILQTSQKLKPAQIRNIVFINYKAGTQLVYKPVPVSEALYLYLQESWVSNHPYGAEKFIDWFAGLNFFRLEFGNNQQAIEALCKLADNNY